MSQRSRPEPTSWSTVGIVAVSGASIAVASSIVLADRLDGYPVLTGQAARYGLAAVILWIGAHCARRRLIRPRRHHVPWLVGLAATGMAGFNVALVLARTRAEPAAIAVVVGSVPVVLAIVAPLIRRQRPHPGLVGAAVIVSVGAALVVGAGRASAAGVALAIAALGCEAAFTLLAVPVLRDLDALSLSFHSCWIAAGLLAIAALALDGAAAAIVVPTATVTLTLAYIAVVVTAGAFTLWYTGVGRLGPERAGLFAGLMPVAAALIGVATGDTTVNPPLLAGIGCVTAGITIGVATTRRAQIHDDQRRPAPASDERSPAQPHRDDGTRGPTPRHPRSTVETSRSAGLRR